MYYKNIKTKNVNINMNISINININIKIKINIRIRIRMCIYIHIVTYNYPLPIPILTVSLCRQSPASEHYASKLAVPKHPSGGGEPGTRFFRGKSIYGVFDRFSSVIFRPSLDVGQNHGSWYVPKTNNRTGEVLVHLVFTCLGRS